MTGTWTHAWRLARRELRGGTRGFRIFLACLILGVTTIAAVGSLNQSISDGLARDGKALLGGDVNLRLYGRTLSDDERTFLRDNATISYVSEMRAMVRHQDKRQLVELKAVDNLYPLVGQMVLSEGQQLDAALADNGAVIAESLMIRLGLKLGDSLEIGKTTVRVTALIEKEPDEIASVINFGPRVMISMVTLKKTELIQPGSVVRHFYRLELTNGVAPADFVTEIEEKHPEAGWQIRTPDKAAPQVQNFVNRLALFLSFVGFTTLLIGGVGVSSGIRDYMDGKIATIATFKCLGAPSPLIFQTYLIQILLLSTIGIAIGSVLGASVPFIAHYVGGSVFPVVPVADFYPAALLKAAVFGILTVLSFALWPLGRSQSVGASALFRDKSTPISTPPGKVYKYATYGFVVILIAMTILSAHQMNFAIAFVIAAALIIALLKGAGHLVTLLARRVPHIQKTAWRLAIAALHRPGTTAPAVIMSLGLGLSVLVAVSQIDQNLRGQISDELPAEAPAFFFIDIQNDQVDGFVKLVENIQGAKGLKHMPSLRGRITEIKGVSVDNVSVAPDAQWAIRGDRALTYSAKITEGSKIVKGQWWPEDYRGAPQISFDAKLAKGFGVDIGDTLTLNILGRNVTATISSLREINWRSMRFDFAIIMSPGLLEHAPHSHIAATHASEEAENVIEKAVAQDYPNISLIRVKEALEAARNIMNGISTAIALAASLTVLAGVLVLGGAMASGRERRTYEAIIFKVLGATRAKMLTAYLIEYGVLGLVTGVISLIIGALTSWGVITFLMNMDWKLYPGSMVLTLILCLILTIGAGFVGTWRALGQKAAPHLRNE